MSSRVQMWLSLGLIVMQTLQAVSFLGSSFKFLSEMDNIRFDLFIVRSLPTWSPLDCSRKCETHGTCLSFQYSSLSGQCRLFNTIFIHQDAGVYDIGWQYYVASNRDCREPFIDGRELDICFMFAGFNNLTEGMKECAAIQSSVISIKTEEQNELLIRLTGTLSNVSLPNDGYKRPFIQGIWNGTDWISDNGTPLVYTNWVIGHPQIDDEKRYIRSINGKWKSTKSSIFRPIFCSYKP